MATQNAAMKTQCLLPMKAGGSRCWQRNDNTHRRDSRGTKWQSQNIPPRQKEIAQVAEIHPDWDAVKELYARDRIIAMKVMASRWLACGRRWAFWLCPVLSSDRISRKKEMTTPASKRMWASY
jgi:hypothetical protein